METLLDPAVQACPYSLYSRLRREAPLYRMPDSGFYLVTSHQLCREIIRDPDLFISGVTPMDLNPRSAAQEVAAIYRDHGWMPAASCSTSDPPRHTRVRALLDRLFSPARVRDMAPAIRETSQRLVDDMIARGDGDFVSAFSHPLPMLVIARQIGVPVEDIDVFKQWSDAIVDLFGMMADRERQLECARLIVDMQHYFKAQIDERRRRPTDDLLSLLARSRYDDGAEIPMNELLSIICIDLLASGNETTTAALSSGMCMLAEQPDIFARLKREPARIATFIEEVLRLESPAQGMFREVTRDTVIGGVALRAGDILSLRFGAANRDPDAFGTPDEIDLDRAKPGAHLAFGMGRHHCIGAPLARQEMIISFEILTSRLEAVRMLQPDAPLRYTPSFFGRNLEELPISFAASRRGG